GAALLNAYELYEYDTRNRVVQRRLYYRQSQPTSGTDFDLYQEQRFQYVDENKVVSRNYYFTSGKSWLQKWTETLTENRRPVRASSYNPDSDGTSRGLLFEDRTYVYEGGRLAKEEYRNAKHELYQTNERHYNGRTAEVGIIYPGQSRFVIQVLDYDRRGRLIKQQFRNPNFGTQLQTLVAPVFPPISVFEYND
ncbi:MAG: hypothetical protein LH609_13865, partial [Rudanella sp.]|nr:hypothetical protein [Rudanella sp.]